MRNIRIIPRLDIKGPNLIKGVHLEGLRVVGDPQVFAERYYEMGADELIYMDSVASLYGRNNLTDIVRHTASNIFIPITVGGGLRSVDDVKHILRCGADKVAINTAAVQTPSLLTEVAELFGSQCMVLSIEAIKMQEHVWHAFTDNGREITGLDVVQWAKKGEALGAGEILLTSVDKEGTRDGFDVELVRAVTDAVNIPVIASGGMGKIEHFSQVVEAGGADAVAMADVLHYERLELSAIRHAASEQGLQVRTV